MFVRDELPQNPFSNLIEVIVWSVTRPSHIEGLKTGIAPENELDLSTQTAFSQLPICSGVQTYLCTSLRKVIKKYINFILELLASHLQ